MRNFPGVITEDETADKDENKPTEVASEKPSKEDQESKRVEEIPDTPEELLILDEAKENKMDSNKKLTKWKLSLKKFWMKRANQ